jgi:hypothetical protein
VAHPENKNSDKTMMSGRLQVNVLLKKEEGEEPHIYRVLHIDPTTSDLAVIDVQDPKSLPEWWAEADLEALLARKAVTEMEEDRHHADTRPDSAFSSASLKVRDRRWKVLQPYLKDTSTAVSLMRRSERGRKVREINDLHGIARDKSYGWLRQFWQKGQTVNALLPNFHRCGAPGKERTPGDKKLGRPRTVAALEPEHAGLNVTPRMRELIAHGAKRFWGKKIDGRSLSKREAYQRTLETFFTDGYKVEDGVRVPQLKKDLPTFRQFRYWLDKRLETEKTTKKRQGASRYALENRPVLGSTTHLSRGPGDLFLIDATVGDIYLVSSINPQYVVGRPVIYLVVDHFSRMIAGFYVGFEGPSWLGAMMALENAFTEKVSFCKRYGIEIREEDWPCRVYPQSITADRGEMVGYASDQLVTAFNMRITNTPPFRADFKSLVERQFGITTKRGIERQPGWVDKMKDRGGADYRLDATFDIHSFTQLMIELILFNNQSRRIGGPVPKDYPLNPDREPTPLSVWNWGMEVFPGLGRHMDRRQVRINLLPKKTARTGRRGLVVHSCQLHYGSATGKAEGWFEANTGRKSKKIEVSYDPRDVSSVFIRRESDGAIEECPLTPADRKHFEGKTLDEVYDYHDRRRNARHRGQVQRLQDEAALNARIGAITQKAERRMVELLGNDTPTVDGIRDTRQIEREQLRKSQAFTGGGDESDSEQDDSTNDYIPFPS